VSNRITLAEFDVMQIGDIAKLPIDQLALLAEDINSAAARAKLQQQWIQTALAMKYGDRETDARKVKGPTGSVSIDDGDYVVKATITPKVDWDQRELKAAVEQIRAMDEPVDEYVEIRTEIKVGEARYKAWPSAIRAIFAPARTVSAGKPSYVIAQKKGAE
jgi:hypothetical protein